MSDDIKNRYFGRRQFLLGVGGHILLLPVMTSMLPRALAQAAQAHRRIALFPTFLGMHTKYLQPNRTAINAMLQTHASGVRHMRLQDLPKPISLMVDGGYEDLLSQMNIFANLDMMQDLGHTYGIFCGSGAAVPNDRSNRMPTYGKTIDVMIEKTAPRSGEVAVGDTVQVFDALSPGANIIQAGEDLRAGALVLGFNW
ncbi:MAG: hypothetical protein V4692_11300 [Bdellovibrionota bacterium]